MGETWQIRRPRRGVPRSTTPNLRGMTRAELGDWLTREFGAPRFRADQVFAWLHARRVDEFEAMTNLPKAERAALGERASVERLGVDTVQRAADGTRKLRLRTADGEAIESVLIPNDERGFTQCISSQVGCALDCRFCATASLGFTRNLDTWEIVDQVARARELLTADARSEGARWIPRVTNVVYMGMGEPLHNFNQVRRSIDILTDDAGDAIAGRRITVSTSGLVPAIERFAREGLGLEVGLAVSLNATTDAVRDQVMPINRRWNISTLLAAVREVPTSRRRRVTFEYVLLSDVNDTDADARRLVALLREFRCHVNVIPFNPHPHAPFRRPSDRRVGAFVEVLRGAGVQCWLRTPRGDDIQAACGQLAADA
ncbi:Dual-specificity RNA methyltransferase RlmN [Enhygromyxa salina]|uniref:Probable dual-specificity RNA methyltransferase RlmN n=1 Tax=Enhygromyxa salina TaxID=215803 RepID=A0A2S9XH44_9BACT|nr:23S rRNA (adenine(2503)-C(2))-methyltransferase RlmN [Enhygromyxa salina]PRP92183.1 Dual-specificity RNA methyltransferase RlmN [Enhygromyxa salina]